MRISAWFHPFAVALLVTPAFASPARTQTLASADAVPEGLSGPEWSSIRQQYEQQRHAITGGLHGIHCACGYENSACALDSADHNALATMQLDFIWQHPVCGARGWRQLGQRHGVRRQHRWLAPPSHGLPHRGRSS